MATNNQVLFVNFMVIVVVIVNMIIFYFISFLIYVFTPVSYLRCHSVGINKM